MRNRIVCNMVGNIVGNIVSNTINIVKRSTSSMCEIGNSNGLEISKIRYSNTHEYLKIEKKNGMTIGTIGISTFASKKISEIVYAEIINEGEFVEKNNIIGYLETVKSLNNIYAPINGIILEQNNKIAEHPRLITEDPLGEGWLLKVSCNNLKEDNLMSNEEYHKYIEEIKAQYREVDNK